MYKYITNNVCSRAIDLDIENDIIKYCNFVGGCPGNTQGIAKLVIGMKVEDVIQKLKGIQCRNGTSCPDQLSLALEKYLKENK